MRKLTDLRDVNSISNSSNKSSLSLPISIVVNSVINHKLLHIFYRGCIKEKLTSPMRDFEEMLVICLSHNRRRCRVQDSEMLIHFLSLAYFQEILHKHGLVILIFRKQT